MVNKFPVNPGEENELISQLYSEASTEEPGHDLDAAILAQARDAITEKRGSSGLQGIYRWQRFGSIAATFVVVITIGMLYHSNQSSLMPEAPIIMETSSVESAPAAQDDDKTSFMDIEERESVAEPVLTEPKRADVLEAKEAAVHKSEETVVHKSMRLEQSAPAKTAIPRKSESTIDAQINGGVAPAPLLKDTNTREEKLADEMPVTIPLNDARREEAPQIPEAGPSRMLAPSEMLLEKKRKPSMESKMQSAEALLQTIRSLVKAGKYDEAKKEWQRFNEAYPSYQGAEDLAKLFGS